MKTGGPMRHALLAVAAFATLGAFAKTMALLTHNEQMYVAASVLASRGQVLYTDFAYLQMPYAPLLNGAIFRIAGLDSWFLLAGKCISFCLLAIATATTALFARRVAQDSVPALAVGALFLLSPTIVNPAAEAANYILPIVFSLLALSLHTRAMEEPERGVRLNALAGACLAVAIGARLTHAALLVPFAVSVIRGSGRDDTKRGRNALAMAGGLAAGLLPMLPFVRDVELFAFDNLGYHRLNAAWRVAIGDPGIATAGAKLAATLGVLGQPENLIALFGIAYGHFLLKRDEGATRSPAHRRGATLALALAGTGLVTALVPTPLNPQYFAMPAAFLYPALAYAWSGGSRRSMQQLVPLLVGLALLADGPRMVKRLVELTSRDRWVAFGVHGAAADIRTVMTEARLRPTERIATLAPIYPLEAGMTIYPELASGVFLYRVGDLLTPEERRRFVGTSMRTIGDLLDRDPPGGILVRFEGTLDDPLVAYAIRHAYKPVDIRPGMTLYLRPGTHSIY